jgi:error-prone DNA polymerase
LSRALADHGIEEAERLLHRISSMFSGRTHVELQRHHRRDEAHRNHALAGMAARLRLPLLATNGVRYARAEDKELHDVLTCIREGTSVEKAGRLLGVNRERYVKSASEMYALFADLPSALDHSWELSQTLAFTLEDLGYKFPDYPLPQGETKDSFLRQLAETGARVRFPEYSSDVRNQISRELTLIAKLGLAGYFLIVWDIVQFCRRENILVQGRGSAANSIVCYALGITAVDPIERELLFERFLSEERGEWPDIDLDLPSGDQRERVIQYLYQRYGEHGAAMTANVITYRDRSAAREVGKAMGFSLEQADTLSKCVSSWSFGEIREKIDMFTSSIDLAGFSLEDIHVRHFVRLFMQIQNLPRHLGQHSGGMVVTLGRLDEVVPLEPASMPGRVVIQWDKDDCADLHIIKVDLLGLGMLAAFEEAFPIIRDNEGVDIALHNIPKNVDEVYEMLQKADTVGLFQVESRAQMSSLPRHKPEKFYDIVVQVAIIRPGPIVGGMVHPFFDRRQGKKPVEYLHPSLEPILKRTYGVPLFQEQLLRMAMVVANFTGGEAEELRRAMGFKRSMERMGEIEHRLREGMNRNGIVGAAQEQIVKSITSFALYGFPESHAASFAELAYISAYLKVKHPAAFYIALLNCWPMGFYHPATLIKDAQRHGVDVHPIDINKSGWKCRWEEGAVRLGLRYVKKLHEKGGRAVESAQPFTSVDDLAVRCRLHDDQMTALAHAGALASLGLERRAALWQAARASRQAGALFERGEDTSPSPLFEMSELEETMADYYATDITTGPHLLQHFRARLTRDKVMSARELASLRDGQRVTTAGAVIVRQRPGTAKGFVFLTLEDETGMSQAIVRPDLFREYRSVILGSSGLIVEGTLQNSDGGQCSVRAEKFWPLSGVHDVSSYDFH